MIYTIAAVAAGFVIDLIIGDPHFIPHPVALIGKLIEVLERLLRRLFPRGKAAEVIAGGLLWLVVTGVSFWLPFLILYLLGLLSPWAAFAVEAIMCWQILAVKSLRTESIKVYNALRDEDYFAARRALSMIVGRDTSSLDAEGMIRATVETVAENTNDGIVAPLLFMAIGGAPLGFLYKAINTMDSMVGYIDPPYTYFGKIPARMDDIANLIPARLAALLMLLAGGIRGLRMGEGFRIFWRDRYNHKSPNSAMTESVCAGLLGVRLGGDAWYHGKLHKKKYIGDAKKTIRLSDIKRACSLSYTTAFLALIVFLGAALLCYFLIFAKAGT
ncbi:MAG: cobalamin biosynthesis protein CobD [Lachnospiraceae bacterium]|nr:cobalamin biosynthesis protein CobD [Lachnospiraceae bacterium]